MERYLVIWCHDFLESKSVEPETQARQRRTFEQIEKTVSTFATRTEVVRQGVLAVPTRGPSRYFGGDHPLTEKVITEVSRAVPGTCVGVGVADGLFAASLAARAADPAFVVPSGGTRAFLSSWPVGILDRPDLADILQRLGIRTLGRFAGLPARDVLARFGTDGSACHSAASGRSGELPGLRDDELARGSEKEKKKAPLVRQPGFWGGTAEADLRARAAFARLQSDLGPEEVLVGRLQGGRSPSERARFIPVDAWSQAGTAHGVNRSIDRSIDRDGPWPGRLPPPSPAVVLTRPLPVVVAGTSGEQVRVSARGLLSSAPSRVSVDDGPWEEVTGWAGPWPADDRWWSEDHRRRARVQLITASGAARLLSAEAGGWWLEGVYD